jgi:hypothetical protein
MTIKEKGFLFLGAALISGLFVWINWKSNYGYGLLVEHGEVGYNLVHHHSIKINPARVAFVNKRQREGERRVEYAEIDHTPFGEPTHYRLVTDTIGYGVLLGGLWTVTGSLQYGDAQILQGVMYVIILFVLYHTLAMLFGSARFAFLACLVHLAFLPLVSLNAQPLRDIWAYYATVVLVYAVTAVYCKGLSFPRLLACAVFFALCTNLRPTTPAALGLVSVVAAGHGLRQRELGKTVRLLATFWLTSIVLFWIPFMAYNKMAHDRWFVGATGMGLLEGAIGDRDNPWGYKANDEWYIGFMKEKYGLVQGTPECEEKGTALYLQAFKENPWFILESIVRRIPQFMFPPFHWIFSADTPEIYQGLSLWEKIKRFVEYPSWQALLDYVLPKFYRYVFMTAGYLGMAVMLFKRQYFQFFLLGSVALSGWHFIFSHMNVRYVLTFYWPFSVFVAYLLVSLVNRGALPAPGPHPCSGLVQP